MAERALIVEHARLRFFPADDLILSHGQVNAALFLMVEGEAWVERPEVTNVPVITIEPGDVFGEMSFLDDARVSADVRAYTSCEVLQLDRPQLGPLFEARPDLAARIYRNLAVELRNRLVRTAELLGHYADLNELLAKNPKAGSFLGYA